MTVTLEIDDTVAALLAVLVRGEALTGLLSAGADYRPRSPEARVRAVLETLIDHAQQGVYRPGAWEPALAACIGCLPLTTGETLGLDRFFLVAHEHRLPAGWLLPAFTETSGRLIAGTRGRR